MAFIPHTGRAQEQQFQIVDADTLSVDSMAVYHSPQKAAMLSIVMPGMGQIYNRKYWKLPLVYGGLGALGYSAIWNSRQYQDYFDLYKFMVDNGYQEWEGRTLREVEWYKNSHLRYKNLMIILTIGFYAIQAVDASVDAHLYDYDISEDLSLTVDPVMIEPVTIHPHTAGKGINTASFGLRCCLSF